MVNIQIEEKQKKYLDALARLLTNNESQKKDTKENYEELLKEVVKQICQVKLEGDTFIIAEAIKENSLDEGILKAIQQQEEKADYIESEDEEESEKNEEENQQEIKEKELKPLLYIGSTKKTCAKCQAVIDKKELEIEEIAANMNEKLSKETLSINHTTSEIPEQLAQIQIPPK
ncbi:917_t:CDS:2 [Entrophospora sp. SA101]|nr:917_t:CDS:2 [Entrophospora sp. SA101]